MISLAVAELVGVVIESALFGAYLILVFASIYAMRNAQRANNLNWIVIMIASALFMLVFAHWLISFIRAYDAFIQEESEAGGAAGYLFDLKQPKMLASLATYSLCSILMDILLTWRLHVIWRRSILVAVLPTLCVIATIVTSFTHLHLIATLPNKDLTPDGPTRNWPIATHTLTIFVNVYASALISFRIIANGRGIGTAGTKAILMPIVHIIIESALLYSLLSIIVLTTYLTNNYSLFIAQHIAPPLIGINFSLILVRIGLGFAERSFEPTPPSASRRRLSFSHSHAEAGLASNSSPLKVMVTEHVENDAKLDTTLSKAAVTVDRYSLRTDWEVDVKV